MGDDGKTGAELSEQAIDWLVALDCGTADERAFDAWRAADPRHAAAFAQVAATWRRTADPRLGVMIDQPAPQPEPDYAPPPRGWSRRAFGGGAIAATLAVAGGGAFLAWPRRAYAATAIGERQTIPLPDGSHAMLNTDTRVSWRFGDVREFWVERGEAMLLVEPARQPFQLRSAPIDARLSTGRFGLRLDPNGGRLLVIAGRALAGSGADPVMAGSALTVSEGRSQIAAVTPDVIAAATAWETGRIVFNGMTLSQAIAEFNRYLPDKIALDRADLGTVRLGGTFQIDDPDTFLLGLQQGFGIDHRREAGRIVLFPARR